MTVSGYLEGMGQHGLGVGNLVRVTRMSTSLVGHTEEHLQETVALFERCIGHVLRIEGFGHWGGLELNVSDDGSQASNYCYHTIWIEPECVELVATPPRPKPATPKPKRRR